LEMAQAAELEAAHARCAELEAAAEEKVQPPDSPDTSGKSCESEDAAATDGGDGGGGGEDALKKECARLAAENQAVQLQMRTMAEQLRRMHGAAGGGGAALARLKNQNNHLRRQVQEMQATQRKFLGSTRTKTLSLGLG
jgi:hypothetical protein